MILKFINKEKFFFFVTFKKSLEFYFLFFGVNYCCGCYLRFWEYGWFNKSENLLIVF